MLKKRSSMSISLDNVNNHGESAPQTRTAVWCRTSCSSNISCKSKGKDMDMGIDMDMDIGMDMGMDINIAIDIHMDINMDIGIDTSIQMDIETDTICCLVSYSMLYPLACTDTGTYPYTYT